MAQESKREAGWKLTREGFSEYETLFDGFQGEQKETHLPEGVPQFLRNAHVMCVSLQKGFQGCTGWDTKSEGEGRTRDFCFRWRWTALQENCASPIDHINILYSHARGAREASLVWTTVQLKGTIKLSDSACVSQ